MEWRTIKFTLNNSRVINEINYDLFGVRTNSKEDLMCYNCGCQMPDNDMGNPNNITDKTFAEAAKAAGQKPGEAKKNTFELLQKTLESKK